MRYIYPYIVLVVILLSSCHGKRLTVKNFVPVDDLSELNGRYINQDNKLNHVFNIYGVNIDIADINFRSKDSLSVSYVDIGGSKTIWLKGKRKKNFFEIYLENRRFYLPPVFATNHIDRLRIGKGKDEKLLIYKWDEHYGFIMPLGAGGFTTDERQYSFSRYGKEKGKGLYLVKVGEKWGYVSQGDSIVIAPTYDYALPFRQGMARVSRNNQWGFIDTKNREVIPLVYDSIIQPKDKLIQVCKNGKWGLVDTLNNEVSPLKYDRILPFGQWRYSDSLFVDLAEVRINNKIGFIDKQGREVIPAEYDKIDVGSAYGTGYPRYFRTRSGIKYGYASSNGILCKPIFEKAGKSLRYSGFSPKNKTLADEIGRYSEVIYNGEPYLFTEKGMLYKYKKKGFFKENKLVVDFDSGFYLDVK